MITISLSGKHTEKERKNTNANNTLCINNRNKINTSADVTIVFSKEIQDLRFKLEDSQHFCIDQGEVERAFLSVRVNKSYGPDNICGTQVLCKRLESCISLHF